MLSDTETCALVGKNGSVDWLGFPRVDSGACFAALLGGPEHGRWQIAPEGRVLSVKRQYREGTLILETEFTTAEGVVRLIDFMPPRGAKPDLIRIVEGVSGRVPMGMEYVVRFDYGSQVPWVRKVGDSLEAIAGPNALSLRTPVALRGENMKTVASFAVARGDRVPFVLTWHPSHEPPARFVHAEHALRDTVAWWTAWTARCQYDGGPYREPVLVSLRVLKGLTYAPTGGIAAAATTSLPEWIGSTRNWDYRYCWLRDATFTLLALLRSGYHDEATAWRDWLLRSVAGDVSQLQTMYGVAGERRLTEWQVPWLPGYERSAPVRVGNAAVEQLQLDVYGEVMDAMFQSRCCSGPAEDLAWPVEKKLLDFLESNWRDADEGIWEVRGPRRAFTHSKVMCWVAFDRAVRSVEMFGLDGPVERWRLRREEVHRDICEKAFDPELGAFTQSYGSCELDASLLLLPHVGFLPATDPRMLGTVHAIERTLMPQGLVQRYTSKPDPALGQAMDGLPAGEGAFLACSFWLADNYALTGRRKDALALFEHLLSLRNDVGLLAEEYDPVGRRQLGNFPQAFSHVALVNTALDLERESPGRKPGSRGPEDVTP